MKRIGSLAHEEAFPSGVPRLTNRYHLVEFVGQRLAAVSASLGH